MLCEPEKKVKEALVEVRTLTLSRHSKAKNVLEDIRGLKAKGGFALRAALSAEQDSEWCLTNVRDLYTSEDSAALEKTSAISRLLDESEEEDKRDTFLADLVDFDRNHESSQVLQER